MLLLLVLEVKFTCLFRDGPETRGNGESRPVRPE